MSSRVAGASFVFQEVVADETQPEKGFENNLLFSIIDYRSGQGGSAVMKSLKVKYMILLVTALLIVVVLLLYIAAIREKAAEEQPVRNEQQGEETLVTGKRITKAEAIRLFSFFFYTDAERECLSNKVGFADTEGKWYASYVKAGIHAGYLVPTGRELYAENNLNCGEFRDMLLRVCAKTKISFEDLMISLPERLRTVRNKDELLLQEFLQIYCLCMEAMAACEDSEKPLAVERTSFLVVNVRETDSERYFITESGASYRCAHLQDYSEFFSASGEQREVQGEDMTQYRFTVPEVLYCGKEIVFITGFSERAVTIPNALIVYGEGETLDCYINGDGTKLSCMFPLSEKLQKQIADITIQGKKVTTLTLKPDTIRGKVLLTGSEQIEVEGYGKLSLQENYRIYKLYGEFSMEQTNSILVGYSNVTFVLEGNEICAAIIHEAIKAENIRVLISVDRSTKYLHEQVVVSSQDAFTTTVGDTVKEYLPGEELVFDYEDVKQTGERIFIKANTESGKVQVKSIRRSYGTPAYRGTIEIAAADGGLILVNELPIEEYLYSVVPSEMPVSHGEEALKVQAICARSYAYQQLMANRYAKYGAHVDDTVNCQVYNNAAETQSSIYAVKDTYGKVMKYGDTVVSAFYFSTSAGYTSSIEEVWENYAAVEYFSGRLQLTEDSRKAVIAEARKKGMLEEKADTEEALQWLSENVCLSEEACFKDFIRDETIRIETDGKQLEKKVNTYDSGFSWYRWQVTLGAEQLSNQIDRLLAARIAANPNDVLTLVSHEGSFVTPSGAEIPGKYEKAAIVTLGRVQSIEPVTRAKSGMLTEIVIRGTANTVLVRNQTNIRTLLAPLNTTVFLANDVTVDGFSLMPSAFFYVEPGSKDGETVFRFCGGGYGHGVGMSQNGVKNLAQAGYTYEGILEHYYKGISIGYIY